jgi:NAD(P)-dependent dehydrogenase (short-subunit alcohol dehydrogenase family)
MTSPIDGNPDGPAAAAVPTMSELFSLRGRIALITGGATGLGLSIAHGLAQAGATVVLASRNQSACESSARDVADATGALCAGERLDVTDERDVDAAFDRIVERFGGLDVLVNCAGINVRNAIEEVPLADFDTVLDINLRGSWLCCRAAGRVMRPAGRGSVINLGSALSSVGIAGRTPYCSAKAGVLGLTRAAALEWAGTGLRCNTLCPGPFLTDLNRPLLAQPERAQALVGRTALNRWGELHEIRGAALFLASDASSYVTGTELYVDGGWTAQ